MKILFYIAAAFMVISCRSEDMMTGYPKEAPYFKTLRRYADDKKIYGKLYRQLYGRRDSILAPTQKDYLPIVRPLAIKNGVIGKSGIEAAPVINWFVHSQTVVLGDGRALVFYPVMKGGDVSEILLVSSDKLQTSMAGYTLSPQDAYYADIKGKFTSVIDSLQRATTMGRDVDNCFRDDKPCEIEVIIIHNPKTPHVPIIGSSISLDPIGCFEIRDCPDDDSNHDWYGGGGDSHEDENNNNEGDPCKKVKANKTNPEVASKLAELKSFSHDLKGEKSFKIRPDGTTSPVSQSSTNHIDPGDYTGYSTAIHSHPRRKIQMFSPEDIMSFLTLALYQGVGNQGDALDGMVGSTVCDACTDTNNSHYYEFYMNFTGTYQELVDAYNNLSAQNFVDIVASYTASYDEYNHTNSPYYDVYKETVSNEGLQKLFFKTLKLMGLENKITLQSVGKNGSIKKFNSNDQENGTNCN